MKRYRHCIPGYIRASQKTSNVIAAVVIGGEKLNDKTDHCLL